MRERGSSHRHSLWCWVWAGKINSDADGQSLARSAGQKGQQEDKSGWAALLKDQPWPMENANSILKVGLFCSRKIG